MSYDFCKSCKIIEFLKKLLIEKLLTVKKKHLFEEKLEHIIPFEWLILNFPDYNEDNLSDFAKMLEKFIKTEVLGLEK